MASLYLSTPTCAGHRLVVSPHPVIEIQNMRLDLIAGVVVGRLRHLQHVNNAAGIPVGPLDELVQNMIEV
jgi:hypothetical protein